MTETAQVRPVSSNSSQYGVEPDPNGVRMDLAINLGYWGPRPGIDMDLVLAAEALGYESVWAAEAWGSDAVTVLSWIAARTSKINVGSSILQMPARTPAMTAMTAVTLSELSEGRFKLGLGVSGPQVVEGWHGMPYGRPLGRSREYVAIVRKAIGRQEPLTHDGAEYQIPYRGSDATGLGKPLKMIVRSQHDIPIYLAAIGPKNLELTAEIADGWLPVFYSPERAPQIFNPIIDAGFKASGDPDKRSRFDICPAVTAIVTDDVDAARNSLKANASLYIGGMGAKGKNFYNNLACRYGYEEAAETIQDLYLAGEKAGAAAAVPDALVDELNLIGSRESIRDRLDVWRDAGVTTLNISAPDRHTLEVLADLV